MFRMETANAINSYCAEKRCKEVEMALLKYVTVIISTQHAAILNAS